MPVPAKENIFPTTDAEDFSIDRINVAIQIIDRTKILAETTKLQSDILAALAPESIRSEAGSQRGIAIEHELTAPISMYSVIQAMDAISDNVSSHGLQPNFNRSEWLNKVYSATMDGGIESAINIYAASRGKLQEWNNALEDKKKRIQAKINRKTIKYGIMGAIVLVALFPEAFPGIIFGLQILFMVLVGLVYYLTSTIAHGLGILF